MNLLQKAAWTVILALVVALVSASALATVELFPVAHVDREEPPPERNARLSVVRSAVARFTREERAAVLAIAWGESKLAKYVLFDCQNRPTEASGNCDKGTSRTYFQLKDRTCPELRGVPVGSDESVRVGAECARRHWRHAIRACRGDVEGSFAVYGGRACGAKTKSTREKADWYRRMMGAKQ